MAWVPIATETSTDGLPKSACRHALPTAIPINITRVTNTHGGGVEVLPLREATERYPDYEIYPMLIPANVPLLEKYLVGQGIPESRIKRFPERGKLALAAAGPKWCPQLGQYFVIDAAYGVVYSYCCELGREVYPTSGDFRRDMADYRGIAAEKIAELQSCKPSNCVGCFKLRDGKPPAGYPRLYEFNLSTGLPGGEKCNLKCNYCTYRYKLDNDVTDVHFGQNVYDLLKIIGEDIGADAVINYASGELTVSPHRDKILRLWKKMNWSGQILTNGVVYNQDVADLFSVGGVTSQISVDAGTSETFAKVKGADCFDKVVENTRRYVAAGANITLKYILLQEQNDNQADVDGFIELAADLGCAVNLSIDNRCSHLPMSAREMEMSLRFLRLAGERNLRIEWSPSWFHIENRPIFERVMAGRLSEK
jgi:pyruvate-formate lyase-activating enzyme